MYAMRPLVAVLLCCAAIILAALGLLTLTTAPANSAPPTPPDQSYTTVGGIQYHSVLARQIVPSDPWDARIIKGLPAKDLHLGKHHVLWGEFVSRTDPVDAPLPSAARIDLRDSAGHLHRPLPLPVKNPYTYRPTKIAAGRQVPPLYGGTPAADNIEAGGQLLLYRVPVSQLNNGLFELVIHNPLHPSQVSDLF